jgi:TonB dependent receptor.
VTETRGQSWYTGLQAGVQRRPAHGYAYSLAYTWSSSENDTDGARSFPQDQTNLLADRGPVLNDARHRLKATGMLDLPLGCRLATVVTARSALPYNVTTGTDDNKDGVSTNDRPAGEGRNAARGSAFFQADVRVSRTLHVSQRRLELLIEAFNVTNRANWTDYNGNKSSVASFGQPASAGPPRQIQLGARFDF